MRLSDVEHTFEWAGILFRELTLCCLPDEQFTQDMDSLMAAADYRTESNGVAAQ